MSLGEALRDLFASPAGQAIYGLAVLILVNAALGTAKAVSNGTFDWKWLDLFVRTKIAGRLVPITVVLAAGQLAPDLTILGLDIDLLTAAGLAAAIPVAASEAASVLENIRFGTPDRPPEGADVVEYAPDPPTLAAG